MTYASNGAGGAAHLFAELMGGELGIKLVHVPYKGLVAGAQRHHGRPRADDVRRLRDRAAAGAGRQAARARRLDRAARRPGAGDSAAGRGRAEGFRRLVLADDDRAGEDSAGHSQPAQRRNPRDRDRAGGAGGVLPARPDSARSAARRSSCRLSSNPRSCAGAMWSSAPASPRRSSANETHAVRQQPRRPHLLRDLWRRAADGAGARQSVRPPAVHLSDRELRAVLPAGRARHPRLRPLRQAGDAVHAQRHGRRRAGGLRAGEDCARDLHGRQRRLRHVAADRARPSARCATPSSWSAGRARAAPTSAARVAGYTSADLRGYQRSHIRELVAPGFCDTKLGAWVLDLFSEKAHERCPANASRRSSARAKAATCATGSPA